MESGTSHTLLESDLKSLVRPVTFDSDPRKYFVMRKMQTMGKNDDGICAGLLSIVSASSLAPRAPNPQVRRNPRLLKISHSADI